MQILTLLIYSTKHNHSELDYKSYGFKESDLQKEIFIDGSLGLNSAKLKDIINIVRETYSGLIGVEFLHIQDPRTKTMDSRTYRRTS